MMSAALPPRPCALPRRSPEQPRSPCATRLRTLAIEPWHLMTTVPTDETPSWPFEKLQGSPEPASQPLGQNGAKGSKGPKSPGDQPSRLSTKRAAGLAAANEGG